MGSWSGVPSLPAGHAPTGAELLIITNLLSGAATEGGLLEARFVNKPSDETVTSSATMQNDDDLVVAVSANASYRFICSIRYGAAATPQIKIGFTVPSGATILWTSFGLDNSVTAANIGGTDFADRGGSTPTLGVNGVANLLKCNAQGRVDTSSTAGNLRLQWAQAVSNGTGSVVKAGSFLYVQRVA